MIIMRQFRKSLIGFAPFTWPQAVYTGVDVRFLKRFEIAVFFGLDLDQWKA